jgi:hypothetical protein
MQLNQKITAKVADVFLNGSVGDVLFYRRPMGIAKPGAFKKVPIITPALFPLFPYL